MRRVTAKLQKDCRAKLQKLREQRDGGTLSEPHKLTLTELLAQYRQDCVTRGLRPKTLHSYAQVIRLYLVPALGKHKLRDLRPEHVRKLLAQLVERGLSAATVRYARVILHGALQLALRQELIARNVADVVKPPKKKRPQITPPTPAQAATLIDSSTAAGDRLSALWTLAVFAGCRPGELLALRWEDVDWETRRITIRRNLTKLNKQAIRFDEPKTERGRRRLSLDEEAIDALRAHQDCQKFERERLGDDYQEHCLVFADEHGAPLIPRAVTRHFKRALALAGLPLTIRLYDLRHANATAMLKAGVHPKTAAERLGHSGTALFMDTYAHMLEELDQDAATRVGAAIRSKRQVG